MNSTDTISQAADTPPASATLAKASKPVAKAALKTPVKKAVKAVAPATPTAVKPAVKAATKPTAKAAPKASVKAEKPAKEKKPKLVRDSFTMPKTEYAAITELKQRAGKLSCEIKKSELIRAGIMALTGLSDSALLTALKRVPTIKTGRPAKA